MASIDTMTFDQSTPYAQNAPVTLTIGYTPDVPGVVPTTFTANAVITDASGNQVASSASDFVVNVAQPSGDKVSVADTGSRTWTEASDSGSVAVFTTVA